MPRVAVFAIALAGWFLFSGAAWAHHFTIDLKVTAGKNSKTVHAQTPKQGLLAKKRVKREILKIKRGQKVKVQWTLRNVDKTDVFKDVLVHFFVVKEKEAGQATTPKLDKNVVAESALYMDFRPKDQTEGKITVSIPNAGVYLLRLETIGAAVGIEGHEHFAALDVVVE